MERKQVYLEEVGVVMTDKSDADYDYYADSYDHQYGYFDENQTYQTDLKESIEEVEAYVRSGVDGTYGIISLTNVDSTHFESDDEICEAPIENETYQPEDVVYSLLKKDGKLIRDFITGQRKTEP